MLSLHLPSLLKYLTHSSTVTEKWAKTFPSRDQIMEAFLLQEPDKSTAEQQEAMNMFLNIVYPSIDPFLVKMQKPQRTTHLAYFGKTYVYEIAFAFNLTSKLSDPANVLHNAGIVDDNRNLLPRKSEAPAKKRRKKTVTKLQGKAIETDYYMHVKTVRPEARFCSTHGVVGQRAV
jgi:hypothetical protein